MDQQILNQAIVQEQKDAGNLKVEFFLKEVEEDGKVKYVDFIRFMILNDSNTLPIFRANDIYKKRFPTAWNAYQERIKKGQDPVAKNRDLEKEIQEIKQVKKVKDKTKKDIKKDITIKVETDNELTHNNNGSN